mgnify:CR=1 FL=1
MFNPILSKLNYIIILPNNDLGSDIILKSYKKIATNLADEYFTKFRLLKHPVPYNPVELEGVNTDEDEYLPMLTPDNNYLYLTRKNGNSLVVGYSPPPVW